MRPKLPPLRIVYLDYPAYKRATADPRRNTIYYSSAYLKGSRRVWPLYDSRKPIHTERTVKNLETLVRTIERAMK